MTDKLQAPVRMSHGDPDVDGVGSGEPDQYLNSSPQVHVFRDSWADRLFAQMAADPHPEAVTRTIDRLATSLLDPVRRLFVARGEGVPVPVVILRGGLLMLNASRKVMGPGSWGFLIPATRGRGEQVTIQRVDVPTAAPGTGYLLVDPIVNTGETVIAALSMLETIGVATSSLGSVKLACIF